MSYQSAQRAYDNQLPAENPLDYLSELTSAELVKEHDRLSSIDKEFCTRRQISIINQALDYIEQELGQ